MNMSKHVLTSTHLKILYFSLVHPYITYGLRLWGNAPMKYLKTLQIAQNKAIRCISGAKFNESASPLYKNHRILKIGDLYELHLLQFMYDFVNQSLPHRLLNLYDYNTDIHNHNTRHSTDPRPPRCNIDAARRSFLVRAPSVWMGLDTLMKQSASKRALTRHITRTKICNY